MRIALPDAWLLLLTMYTRTSATNGGYSVIYALTYSKAGRLLQIDSLGRYGYYLRKDMEDRDAKGIRWTSVKTTHSLTVLLNSPADIRVTTRVTREKEVRNEYPVKRNGLDEWVQSIDTQTRDFGTTSRQLSLLRPQ